MYLLPFFNCFLVIFLFLFVLFPYNLIAIFCIVFGLLSLLLYIYYRFLVCGYPEAHIQQHRYLYISLLLSFSLYISFISGWSTTFTVFLSLPVRFFPYIIFIFLVVAFFLLSDVCLTLYCEAYLCVLVAQLYLTLCDSMDVAHQAPLSLKFSREGYWSGLSFPSPESLFSGAELFQLLLICKTLYLSFKSEW